MTDIRREMIAQARSICPLDASNPEQLPTWLELLGLPPVGGKWDLAQPFRCWREGGKWQTSGVSTCGLVVCGLWRRLGIPAPFLTKPYVFADGGAIVHIIAYAQSVEAWRTPLYAVTPLPGDCMIIGDGIQTHALTVVELDGPSDDLIISVDAGQVGDTGLQAIRERRRWLSSGYLGGKRVIGWASLARLGMR